MSFLRRNPKQLPASNQVQVPAEVQNRIAEIQQILNNPNISETQRKYYEAIMEIIIGTYKLGESNLHSAQHNWEQASNTKQHGETLIGKGLQGIQELNGHKKGKQIVIGIISAIAIVSLLVYCGNNNNVNQQQTSPTGSQPAVGQ